MRIIKQGVAPSEREYQVTCSSCKTIFAFYMNSVKTRSDQREGTWYEVTCPHKPCSKTVTMTKLYPVTSSLDPY